MMAFLGRLMARASQATRDPEKMPVALLSSGAVLGTAALSLIVFNTPAGIFLRLPGSAPAYLYYSILVAAMIYGLAVAAVGLWIAPLDPDGWHAAGKIMLCFCILLLVIVTALVGGTLIK